jgi:class 3 adenylate cyclase
MLQLAARLRESSGGDLDDSAIQAVAEATGTSVEYVRLIVATKPSQEKRSLSKQVHGTFLSLDPNVRRYVMSGAAAALMALVTALEDYSRAQAQGTRMGEAWGLFGMLRIIATTLGVYNVCLSRDGKAAAISGAIFGGFGFIIYATLNVLLGLTAVNPSYLVLFSFLGALSGALLLPIVKRYRKQLGLKDPLAERQELLRQLVDLQEKLRTGEQSVTFLSVDIVGSTKMKQASDPLSVEFTFNEYHRFAEMVAKKHAGRVHSTAGDGVTMAFDHPQTAFSAAKNLQTGLIELNTFRNKIGTPIVVRCGIHTGTVVAPDAGDIKSLNFASVIDIAAHLQKCAPPGGIVLSEAAAMHLPGGPAAFGASRVETQDVRGVLWQSRSQRPEPASSGPPPSPGGPSMATPPPSLP